MTRQTFFEAKIRASRCCFPRVNSGLITGGELDAGYLPGCADDGRAPEAGAGREGRLPIAEGRTDMRPAG